MKIKTLLILALYLISVSSFANSTQGQKQALAKKVYKTELFLKEAISKDLTQLLGQSKLLIKVDIGVDEKAVFDEVGGFDNKWNKINALQLPGLFIGDNNQSSLKEVKSIKVDNVLSHIKDINVDIVSSEPNLDMVSLKSTIVQILKSNYNRLDKVKLVVNTSIDKKLLKANSIETESSTNKKSSQLSKLLSSQLLWTVLGFVLLFTLLITYFIKDLANSVKQVRGSIENKDMSGSMKLEGLPELPSLSQKPEVAPAQQIPTNLPNMGFNQKIDVLRSILVEHSEIFSEMITFNMQTENFVDLVVLMEVVPLETRKSVYTQLPKDKVDNFRQFLLDEGEQLFENMNLLELNAKKMIDLLKLSSIDPDQFYSYYFKNIANRLDSTQIHRVLRSSSVNEMMHLAEYAESSKVAFAMRHPDFDKMRLTCDYQSLSQDEVKTYLQKIAKICFTKPSFKFNDVREKLLPFLEHELEKVVINKLKLTSTHSFNDLIQENFDHVCTYLSSLVYYDKCDLLANFNNEIRSQLIETMPELVRERLSQEAFEVQESSLYLKAVLYNELMGLDQTDVTPIIGLENHAA